MVNYIPLNCNANRKEYSDKLQKGLMEVFKYVNEVNVHVLFDFIAPTSDLGCFDCILFIDIPYAQGNYYRNGNKVYLNSLAIAIRKFEETEVIDVDESGLYTEEGSWDYNAQIESDRSSFKDYIYRNIDNVKHFDITVMYSITAKNCKKSYSNEVLKVNHSLYLKTAIDNALEMTKSKGKYQKADNIIFKDTKSNNWSPFISEFLDKSEEHTRHGVLTRKKIEVLTTQKTGRLMQQIFDSVGKKLCIIGGKAGTGKTLALMRVMYNEVRKGENAPKHNCRLLTYNNMLVADIKMTMKHIGDFTQTKASISTLHKFFYDIYVKSPVCVLHMDAKRIEKIFALCLARAMKVNSLIKVYINDHPDFSLNDTDKAVEYYQQNITKAEANEIKDYIEYLSKLRDAKIDKLKDYAIAYMEYKKKMYLDNYNRQAYLAGYNDILKELYLIYHNLDEFVEKYGFCTQYCFQELQAQEQFRNRYQDLFNKFLDNAETRYVEDDITPDELLPEYDKEKTILDADLRKYIDNMSEDEKKGVLKDGLIKIKRKVNWSKYILIDEAQDCSINEKALLLELNGSDNTIIATGGKDQLIRRPEENDWTQLFGHPLENQPITIRSVSKRQKGNIVDFLNAFSSAFDIDTQLNAPDEIIGKGRVIIDCRNVGCKVPKDILIALHKAGEDYGCSNFENMMFLLPRKGYTDCSYDEKCDVSIDENSTVRIKEGASSKRSLKLNQLNLPSELKQIDGTINDKRKFLQSVGQDNTRCILYDSCRGLEAWNVMCMDFDTFYYEKLSCKEAEEYGTANGGGLFVTHTEFFKMRFAALWCYMAMTRAMDTLYIKISNPYNEFAIKLINTARTIPHVDVLEGEYTEQ